MDEFLLNQVMSDSMETDLINRLKQTVPIMTDFCPFQNVLCLSQARMGLLCLRFVRRVPYLIKCVLLASDSDSDISLRFRFGHQR